MKFGTAATLAGVVAANVATVVVAARYAERNNPPRGRFVEVEGLGLHYLEVGPVGAPTVVLLHGNGMTADDFEGCGLLARLGPRFRVIAFDRPGFGHSDRHRTDMPPEVQARVLAKALDRIGVGASVVLGHSWGTLVALAMALDTPDKVHGLVLVSGYYRPTRRADGVMMSGPSLPVVGPALRYTVAPIAGRLVMERVIQKSFAPAPVPTEFRRVFSVGMATRPKQLRAAAEESRLMVPSAARLSRRYHEITCPVALFHSAADQISEPDQGPWLHREIPNSTLTVSAQAGHMLHYAIPGPIADAIASLAAPVAIERPSDVEEQEIAAPKDEPALVAM